jgi:aspartate racemase
MAPPRRVGVVGGMGPEATVLLLQRVIARTPAVDDADHVPVLVDMNTQVPSRIRALIEGTGEDPGPVLAAMAGRLEAMGAEALAMPCNTAHNYAAAIRAAVSVPFLDMVEATADDLADAGVWRIGLLASPAVRITGVFERAFGPRGIANLYPADEAPLLAAIRAVKAGRDLELARATLREAGDGLLAAGAERLVVGCSEFSLIAGALQRTGRVLDSLDVLADAVVSFATQPNRMPSGEPG